MLLKMGAPAEMQKRWTYEDYYRLEGDQRYEVIGGELIPMAPAPDTWHQDWVWALMRDLSSFVEQKKLGKAFISPIDVVLDAENTVQPDIVFVAAERLSIIERRAIFGVPDLVMEVISPHGAIRDRHEKSALYARFGVKEYWLADPANRSVEVFLLENGGYKLQSAAEGSGEVKSSVLPGLLLNIAQMP